MGWTQTQTRCPLGVGLATLGLAGLRAQRFQAGPPAAALHPSILLRSPLWECLAVTPACTPEMGCPDTACAPPGAGTQLLHEGWGAGAGWPAPHQGLHCSPSLCTRQPCDHPHTHTARGRGVGTQLAHSPLQTCPGCASIQDTRPSTQESVPEASQVTSPWTLSLTIPREAPCTSAGDPDSPLPCSLGSGLGWGPSYLHQGRAQPEDAHSQQVLLEPHLHGLVTRLGEESASQGPRGRPSAPTTPGHSQPEGTDSPLSTRCQARAARSSR